MTNEEAIRELKILKEDYWDDDGYGHETKQYDDTMLALDMAIKALEQEPRWIPTSERLPEEDGEYYATVYDTDENYKYMDIAELEDGIWQYKDYVKVLAWMPLPKPYEAESEKA